MEPPHYAPCTKYEVNRLKNLSFIGAFTSRVPSVITGEGGVEGVGGGGRHVAIA